jgi:uncharacterized membrane protein (DUF2068 family)
LSGFVLGIIILILGLITLGVAVGLWRLRLWALVLALIVLAINIILDGLSLVQTHSYTAATLFGPVLSVIVFIYLLAVSGHFRG